MSTRKRGANYTHEEKALLLDLITQYKNIVECKRTGGIYILKKKEAWNEITTKYNSSCTSGPRDTDQLKALYDNMKQKTRRELGESNKSAYINAEESHMVTAEAISQAVQVGKEDKIEMNKTGGGFWKPKLGDNDAKVLAIIQDQIEPLHNPYDSASNFFKESVSNTIDKSRNANYIVPAYVTTMELENKAEDCQGSANFNVTNAPQIIEIPEQTYVMKNVETVQACGNSPVIRETPKHRKILKTASKQRNILKPKTSSAEAFKRLYFKKKCQNAQLERKKLMLEIVQNKEEHKLKMEILKNKLYKLK